ncbi:hypothetical protein [Mycobacterium avium]|uniref:hypothetical protein n=1 Tax=Mycobacterium avium TaxID=1764 RepID=UPI001CCA3D74|nr:hypothetical protein [Mycobacterium avium]MBZ4576175.1 hypothetical protein [Mycobacterium avium subsp. hominissuis]
MSGVHRNALDVPAQLSDETSIAAARQLHDPLLQPEDRLTHKRVHLPDVHVEGSEVIIEAQQPNRLDKPSSDKAFRGDVRQPGQFHPGSVSDATGSEAKRVSGVYDAPGGLPRTPDSPLSEDRVREIVREETSLLREQLAEQSTKINVLGKVALHLLNGAVKPRVQRRDLDFELAHSDQEPQQKRMRFRRSRRRSTSNALELLRDAGLFREPDVADSPVSHDASPSLGLDNQSVGERPGPAGEVGPGHAQGSDS